MVVFFLRHVRKQFLRLLLVLWSNKDGPSEVQHPSIAVGLEVVGARSSRKIGLGYLGCQFARFFTMEAQLRTESLLFQPSKTVQKHPVDGDDSRVWAWFVCICYPQKSMSGGHSNHWRGW